ncbi:MAG: replicative DNA helicase [Pseudomonadota bacterium]
MNTLATVPVPAVPDSRQAPENLAAEQGLLGAIFLNNTVLDTVSEFLEPEHFSHAPHAHIYRVCVDLRAQHKAADPVTVRNFLLQEGDGAIGAVDGYEYLKRLAAEVVSVANAETYAHHIYEAYLRRQLIVFAQDVADAAYAADPEHDAHKQIEKAESALYTLASRGKTDSGFQDFAAITSEAIAQADAARNRDTSLNGTTTGLMVLDSRLGGLQRSDLVILAGRPSMGKTALATNIAYNAAKVCWDSTGKQGGPVAFFSLEMSAVQLSTRILSSCANVPSDKIRRGKMNKQEDWPRLVKASEELKALPLFVDDTAGLSLSQLRSRALRLHRAHNLGLIVIDYLQLLRTGQSGRQENRVQELSEITRSIKILAKELNVPILALSQLSRAVEQREDKRPQLSDLRESGSIEQDADVVMFVYRAAYYHEKKEPRLPDIPTEEEAAAHELWKNEMANIAHEAEIIIGKQRHGPTSIEKLHFNGLYTRFSDLELRAYDHDTPL